MSTVTASPARTDRTQTPTPRRDRNPWAWLSVVSVLAGVGLWWVGSMFQPTLPSPVEVAVRGWELIVDGTLPRDIIASLRRVFLGFIIGSGLAIPLGFAMGWYRPVRAIVEPWTQFFRTIPPLAIIPLAIVFLGIGEVPKVFVITLASFLVAIIATFQGVVNVDARSSTPGGCWALTTGRSSAASRCRRRCRSSWWACARGSAPRGPPSSPQS